MLTATLNRAIGIAAALVVLACSPVAAQKPPTIANVDEAPLYTGLSWQSLGSSSEELAYTQNNLRLAGQAYESAPVMEKLTADVIDYYSPVRLAGAKWRSLGDAGGILTVISTYFKAPNRYMTIRMGSCSGMDAQPPAADQTGDSGNCVKVWLSDAAAQAPVPPESAFSDNAPQSPQIAAPISGSYPNPLPVPLYSQNNSAWKANRMGWPDAGFPTACDSSTMGYLDASRPGYGCWTTSYAMLYSYYLPGYLNPAQLNDDLINGPGGGSRYANNGAHCNNYMPGGAPYAITGVSRAKTYWNNCAQSNCIDDANVPIIDGELQAGRPLLTYVHYSGVSPQHMVVIVGHHDNTYYINDPITGKQATLASNYMGSYVVDWIYTWNGAPPINHWVYIPLALR